MRIHLLYFAAAREAVGREADVLEVPAAARVRQVLEGLMRRHPALVPFQETLRVAVNEDFVDTERVLHEGDRLALIPPVSGG